MLLPCRDLLWRDAALTLTHPHVLRTHILWRNVVHVKRTLISLMLLVASCGCSRLPTLTPDVLSQAEQKWNARKPESYRLVIEMSGDRVETGRFEVDVLSGQTISLRRNGLAI